MVSIVLYGRGWLGAKCIAVAAGVVGSCGATFREVRCTGDWQIDAKSSWFV